MLTAMSAALPVPPYLTENEFLEFEDHSPVKHEFLNGIVYDMAGGTDAHAVIATNVLALLWHQTRGKRCRPYNSDMLARLQHGEDVRMYYPDVAVYCGHTPTGARTLENPTLVVEVLSASTQNYDRTEKRAAYQRIASLQVLLLISSEAPAVTVWRRTAEGWKSEELHDPAAVVDLPALEAQLALAEIYEGVEWEAVGERGEVPAED